MMDDSYAVGAWLFVRGMGLVYLIAFASLGVQIAGLIGRRGILPVRDRLHRARREFWELPTICWWVQSDRGLKAICAGGVVLALALVSGFWPGPALVALWFLYLSLVNAAGIFLGYQWDMLLLEAGLLAIFLGPCGGTAAPELAPSGIARALIAWLVFRLMFSSGVVKLASGDPTWRDGTAMSYHHETQPLPTRWAWWAHRLPAPVHRAATCATFVAELAVPFLVFFGGWASTAAAVLFTALMMLIAVTGNYGFFHLLSVVLCLPLVHDGAFAWIAPGLVPERVMATPFPHHAASAIGALVLGPLSIAYALLLWRRTAPYARRVLRATRSLAGWRLASGYGLFAVMTTSRPEVQVEGSDDGETWTPYAFRWKPGDPEQPPRFAWMHMPRLDWQMWFSALGRYDDDPWFMLFLVRLLEGAPEVRALLAPGPHARPPRFVRARLLDYRFGDGTWWRVRELGPYAPPITLSTVAW
jgi:hypothetical protein